MYILRKQIQNVHLYRQSVSIAKYPDNVRYIAKLYEQPCWISETRHGAVDEFDFVNNNDDSFYVKGDAA